MSTPEASTTRQRTTKVEPEDKEKTYNPASLSANPNKKVDRNKPVVKPPFADVTMNKFLTYLVLSLLSVAAFYTWRMTVWARDAGGYWNLATGTRPAPGAQVADAISAASAAASSVSSKGSSPSGKSAAGGKADIQSQIFTLATALGIKPAELSAAIRPLIDPSVPNPVEVAQRETDLLKQQIEQQAAESQSEEQVGGGLLGVLGEALLD
ncbi:hypothetical protein P7C73_g1034, partial [Tremellales sp. Uapishka_1]